MAWPRLSGLLSGAAMGRSVWARSKPSVQPHSVSPHGWHHDMWSGERKNSSCPPSERPDSCSPLKEESGENRGWGKKTSERGREKKPSARAWQVWWFCSVIAGLTVWTFMAGSEGDYDCGSGVKLSRHSHQCLITLMVFLVLFIISYTHLSLQYHPSLVTWMHDR